jgi:SpoU rRNA methylase family enzyme
MIKDLKIKSISGSTKVLLGNQGEKEYDIDYYISGNVIQVFHNNKPDLNSIERENIKTLLKKEFRTYINN